MQNTVKDFFKVEESQMFLHVHLNCRDSVCSTRAFDKAWLIGTDFYDALKYLCLWEGNQCTYCRALKTHLPGLQKKHFWYCVDTPTTQAIHQTSFSIDSTGGRLPWPFVKMLKDLALLTCLGSTELWSPFPFFKLFYSCFFNCNNCIELLYFYVYL